MALHKAIYATGRRKTSSARVFLTPVAEGEEGGKITVNYLPFENFFPQKTKQREILQVLDAADRKEQYNFTITVSGGGFTGQAGAVVQGMARALERVEPELRPALKAQGLLTRDPRAVERKKPGRHKARKKPQFSKR